MFLSRGVLINNIKNTHNFRMKTISFAACVIAAVHAAGQAKKPERKTMVKTELNQVPIDELPAFWDWGDIDGVNYLTNIRQ